MSTNACFPGVPEILTLVLASCESFADVIAFASTSREFYAVWKGNASTILGYVGPRCVPAFDEALVAYRAQDIARNAFLGRKLPPKDVDIHRLSGAVHRPELSEISGVMGLHRIVEYAEDYYLHACPMCDSGIFEDRRYHCGTEGDDESFAPQMLPPPKDWAPFLSLSFQRAVYRVLLAGPILTGWYLEPFSLEGVPNRLPPEFPKNLRLFLGQPELPDTASEASEPESDQERVELNHEDLSYLERFIPFDQVSNTSMGKEQDQLFKPLGNWLIQAMEDHMSQDDHEWALSCLYGHSLVPTIPQLYSGGALESSESERLFILREIMRMQVAYESLARALRDFNYKRSHNVEYYDHSPVIRLDKIGKPPFIIMLGVYQLEQVYFGDDALIVTPISRLSGACSFSSIQEKEVDIFSLQKYLWAFSGKINCIDDYAAAPPRVQLFTFLLHRFFGLGSSSNGTWEWNNCDHSPYLEFLSNGLIFTNEKERSAYHGAEDLSTFPPNPVFQFRRMDDAYYNC